MSSDMSETPAGKGKFSWWSAVVKHAVVTTVTLLAVVLIAEVWSDPYLINPLDVPEEMTKAGLSGASIAGLLRDRVALITAKARTATGKDLRIETKGSEGNQIDVKITGTDLSVRALAAEVANLLGFSPLQITGSIWVSDIKRPLVEHSGGSPAGGGKTTLYHISLRDSKGGGIPIFDADGFELDDLLSDAATAILGTIDPVRAANLLRFGGTSQKAEALAFAAKGVDLGRIHDNAITYSIGWQSDPELPRALLVKAYVMASNGMYDNAIVEFDNAGAAFAEVGRGTAGRQYSADGKALISMEAGASSNDKKGFDQARSYLDQVGWPKYDSAEFHEVNLLQLKAERRLKEEGCPAISDIADADRRFGQFEAVYKKFTIAFLLHANMLKNLATFLHFEGERSRSCIDQANHELNGVLGLYKKSKENFLEAIAIDDQVSDAWLQLGILVYQTQISEPEWHPEHANDKATIDEAIDILEHASILDRTNPYIFYRVADSIRSWLAIDPWIENKAYLQRGLDAACRGYALASGQLRIDLEILARTFSPGRSAACE